MKTIKYDQHVSGKEFKGARPPIESSVRILSDSLLSVNIGTGDVVFCRGDVLKKRNV